MKLLTLEDAWEVFLEAPTRARFVALRELVMEEPDYLPAMATLVELEQMLNQRRFTKLQRRIEALLPAWALCPRIHFLAGCAAEALGDAEEVELCRFLSQTCVDGILASGEGSRRRPWLATYPSDARDCLARRGLTIASQRLEEGNDRFLDLVTAENGRTFWFDVSEMIAAGAEMPATASLAR